MFLFVGFSAFAQADNEQIKADFQKYSSALKSRQYTQATAFMPDNLFDVYSKDKLVQEMKQTFESEDTEVRINAVDIVRLDQKIIVENSGIYVPFIFVQKFDLKYINLFDATDDDQSRNSTTKFIVDMLNESMPESTITFDKKEEVFKVDSSKSAVAIKLNNQSNWKFLVIEPSLKNLMDRLLPSTVLQKIKL